MASRPQRWGLVLLSPRLRLDELVLSTPVLLDPITGDRGEISCDCTPDEAQAIARAMMTYRDDLPLRAVEVGAGG